MKEAIDVDGTSSRGLGKNPQLSMSSPARLPPKLG
jgi:hypothetical protein